MLSDDKFQKYDQVCETEKYPPDQNTIVPTYRVDLDLPPRERWSKIALYYEKPVIILIFNNLKCQT